jgi:hypothetical protein
LRRCDLNAGFTEFFLNGKVEIAPATPRPGTLLGRRILQNRPNKKLSETAQQLPLSPLLLLFLWPLIFYVYLYNFPFYLLIFINFIYL